jgi:phosphatidylserine/phosphatidylglycerophosphate/cardiolipin synthase-like enzyme
LAITDAYAGDRHPGGPKADDSLKKALIEIQHLEKELRELKQQYGIYLHQSGASPQAASSSSILPPPGKPSEGVQGFGEVVAIADAAGAIPHWLRMIREAKTGIRMLAFTFDLGGTDLVPVADALVVARKREIPIDIVIDRVWGKGTTMKNLRPTVLRLIRYGVRVRLTPGPKRLHAKIMLADNFMSIGSCNWTANSQFQTERVAILKLSGREAEREATIIDGLFAAGSEWDLHRATPCKTYDSLTEEAES